MLEDPEKKSLAKRQEILLSKEIDQMLKMKLIFKSKGFFNFSGD